MISIALGLLITAAVLGIFLSGSRNYQQDDRFARMQENGRFALDLLASELAMAGYWGGLTALDKIESDLADSCGIGLDADDPIALLNNAASTDVGGYCIATTTFAPSTDVLAVKRVAGSPTSSPDSGKVYLRAGASTGTFIVATTPAGTGETDWRFAPAVYYIRNIVDPDNASNAIPVLARKYLAGSTMSTAAGDESIADGIENIQIELGINTGTGANVGTNPHYYTSAPTSAELPGAVTARIHILVRSREPDPAYTNQKTYRLGSTLVGAANDHYYRRVFSTTVALRNPASLHRLNQVTP